MHGTTAVNVEWQTWTVRKGPKSHHSWWRIKKGVPNKTRSYLGGEGQNTKKKKMAHIKEKKKKKTQNIERERQ